MMEMVLEATARLRDSGYVVDFTATKDGRLRCGACRTVHDPTSMVIDEIVRCEGASDPDDQTILFALQCSCERPGLNVTGFGTSASAADVAVLRRLP